MNQLVVELTINWIEVVEELTVNWIEIAEKLVELLHRLACANIASSMKADNKTIVEKKTGTLRRCRHLSVVKVKRMPIDGSKLDFQ